MAIDPQLLDQVLSTPESRDISASPIVTAVILSDPANAGDLVPNLEEIETNRSKNARRILCLFGAKAAPYLISALLNTGVNARKEGIEILWSMLLGENKWTIQDTLSQIGPHMEVLLDDRRPLPDHMPEYIERDFRGRICDLAYIVLQQLIDSEYDQSLFRSLDENGRDAEIARLKRRGFGSVVA
jgi:hypothetical protein